MSVPSADAANAPCSAINHDARWLAELFIVGRCRQVDNLARHDPGRAGQLDVHILLC